MKTRTMELKSIEIKDDYPLFISLCGKSIWKRDEKNKIVIDHLLDRSEDNYTITSISSTELKPSIDRNKLIAVLKYFFSVCDISISPQSLWATDNCGYKSLMIDYEIDKKRMFESVFNEITKQFPKLKQAENFIEEIPEGKTLLDMVSEIEVAYPETWTIDYVKKEIT